MDVPFDDFKKLEMRVGRIIDVEEPEGSRSILKLTVDFGDEKRTAMSGIKNHYKKEDLVGKDFVFVMNLERKKFLGIESECMILAADNGNANISLLKPDREIEIGSKVR